MTVPKIDNLNAEGLGHLREELEHFDINEVHRAVSDRFESQAAKTPNNTALKSRTQSITYSQLNKRANKLAHAILSSENAKSAAIASLFGHEINSITGLLGILKSGNIFVPLDSTYNPERISFSLEDSLATRIVTNDANLEQAQSLKRPGQQIINVDHMDANLSEENLGLEISAESSALIMYTSGSTGKPKGVVSDHRKLNHRAHYFEPDEKLTHLLSISFIASFDDILGALMSSATLYLYDIKHEGLIPMADWLIEEKITYFRLPSAMLRKFNDYLNVKMRFPDILRISLGGQAVFTQDAKRLLERCSPGCIAKIAFASTEAGRIAQFHFTLKTKIESDVLPVGFPAIGMDINIIDKMGKSLGPNQEGEIVITSSYLAKEYWRDPELTKKIFLPAPEGGDKRMMYTGDIGVMREDGLLELKGRKDFRVKIRGYRIEVSAIEAHLQKFDSVKEVVVASQESSRGGDQYLVAYIVPQGNSMPTVRSLRDSMATKFANFMIPARFVYIKKIPLTASGKIERKLLPAPAPERPDLGNAFVAPSDKFQKKLAKIWEDILAIKPV